VTVRRSKPSSEPDLSFEALIKDALAKGISPWSLVDRRVRDTWYLYDGSLPTSDDPVVDPLTGKTLEARNPLTGEPLSGKSWGASLDVRNLREFLDWEKRTTEKALPKLLRILRASENEALRLMADMIDPRKSGPWKLGLKRHIPGKVPDRNMGEDIRIAKAHSVITRGLRALRQKSPGKTSVALLAEKHGVSDEAIKAVLARVRRAFRDA
jgi:hypothetical protein